MLLASRLSEMHARGAQALPAEPAGAGGGVAAGPPAVGPPPQPDRQDAASAITPSATTPIRLATANLPAPPAAWQSCEASPLSGAREVSFHQASTQPSQGMATPKIPTQALPQIMPDDRRLVARRNTSHPVADKRPQPPNALPLKL